MSGDRKEIDVSTTQGAAKPIVNELSIQVATVNGSGSHSSNRVLTLAIFRMGLPVGGKNIFPSNIAGLPTWFNIRVSKDGWLARKREADIAVCMNAQTARDDVLALPPGALCIYDAPLECRKLRADLRFYEVPFAELAAALSPELKLRRLLANMIYVGVLAELIGIERREIQAALGKQFEGKERAIAPNLAAVDAGMAYAASKLPRQETWRLERMEATRGKILVDGNAAAALGAIFGGLGVVAWYPITPSTSLVESIIKYGKRLRVDEDGRSTLAVVQAEDELAAAGMTFGAGWAGARSMTATSGPGSSLMAESVGLGYFAELPGVIWDVQRVGPSTGLPTRSSQGDVTQLAYLSHGDTRHLVLIPGNAAECFEFAGRALDLAEEFQTPVLVLGDLDLGMNEWISEPFEYPSAPLRRGKVLGAAELEALKGDWGRYRDPDGDGIPWRTLPGTDHPRAAYFTRGSGHDTEAHYSERPEDYKATMDRLARKYETARRFVPGPLVELREARIGLIAYGSTDQALEEARDQLRSEYGLETSYLRLRALPFTAELGSFADAHEAVYVVEQNRDGQMADLIRLELGEGQGKIRKILHYTGLPCDARSITEALVRMEASRASAEPLLVFRIEAGAAGSEAANLAAEAAAAEARPEERRED